MIAAPELEAVERFRAALGRRVGLKFPDYQLPFLADILRRRLDTSGLGAGAYLDRLDDPAAGEWDELADLATVGETYFFRNAPHFQVLDTVIAPAHARSGRPLRVLSAGCATGEEPYSLAIALARRGDVAYAITAIDLNPAALARARRGVYSAWALRETPAAVQERWFTPAGRAFTLDQGIRDQVAFVNANLAADPADPAWFAAERYDVVFCRNVLMYLHPEVAARAVARFATALAPGGHLFLGHAETLRGMSTAFQLCHTNNSFYYRRGAGAATATRPALPGAEPTPATGSAAQAPEHWIGAIRRSSERVAALADGPVEPAAAAAAPVPEPDVVDDLPGRGGFPSACAPVLDALRHERFAEARALFAALPAAARRHPLASLLEAAVLVHGGDGEPAEAACRRGLDRDHGDARYHYLLALCREQAGDLAAAGHHYHAATAHDPGFAMPHLRLGLLARSRHRHEEARTAFVRTLALIDHEDDLHLDLFGGGFTRQAIARLCAGLTTGNTPW